jgi:Protein of unknown function (DUF1566)
LRACGLALLLLAIAPSAWAQTCQYFDDFKDNGDGTVTDPRSGTVWQRCAVGQRWNGSGCSGEGKAMPWWDAMRAAKADRFLGKADWRLPTKDEVEAIVGKYADCKNTKPQRAVSNVFQAIGSKDNDFLGWFWMSSPNAGDPNFARYVDFSSGDVGSGYRSNNDRVRLVRSGQSLALGEFNREFAKLGQYEAAHLAKKRQEEQEATKARLARLDADIKAFNDTKDKTQKSASRQSTVAGASRSGTFQNMINYRADQHFVYSATCTEGGDATVLVLIANRSEITYSSSGFPSAVGHGTGSAYGGTVEDAMRAACRGR